MNTKSITFAAVIGLLTALTLAGSVIVIFLLFGPNGIINANLAFEAAGSILYFLFPLIGGGLWGWELPSS